MICQEEQAEDIPEGAQEAALEEAAEVHPAEAAEE